MALRIDRMAGSDRVSRIAFDLGHNGDPALYLTEATALAQEYELDYLEIVAGDGSIVSSAQWPARFGYKEDLHSRLPASRPSSRKKSCRTGQRDRALCGADGSCAPNRQFIWWEASDSIASFWPICRRLAAPSFCSIPFSPPSSIRATWSGPAAIHRRRRATRRIIVQARTTGQETNAIVYLTKFAARQRVCNRDAADGR